MEDGGWRMEDGGWRVEGGWSRVEGGVCGGPGLFSPHDVADIATTVNLKPRPTMTSNSTRW